MPSGTPGAVTFDQTVPLHHQIYLQMRGEIADGLWLGRNDFPGERELALRFGTSVITSRAALDRLTSDGWIHRRRGKRPEVLQAPDAPRPEPAPVMFPVGPFRPYTYEVLVSEVDTAPAEACVALGRAPGEHLWQCMRSRRYRDRPHSIIHNVQLPEVGQRHSAADLRHKPMVSLLAAQGLKATRMRRRIGVAHAPILVSENLGLTIAERVLVSTFTLHDADDVVLQWVRIYLHPGQRTPEETMELATATWSTSEPM